jgi:tRNA(Ile)-lysidine synthase
LRHARNRVRHGILPRLERGLNPSVRETLAETAEIARSEEEYWQKEVARVLPEVCGMEKRTLRLAQLSKLPLALRRRVIRAVAESLGLRLEFRHVEEILALAPVTAKTGMLYKGWTISISKDDLRFDPPGKEAAIVCNYEYALAVPGRVRVAEAKTWFEAVLVPGSGSPGYNPDHMFDPGLLRSELTVRNWRPGDRFWPAHRKSAKKIKELLQERKVTGTERKLWPVVASGEQIVWVRGFLAPLQLRPEDGSKQALVIREVGSTQTHD